VSASARVHAVVTAAAIAAAGVAVGVTLATRSAPPPALEAQPGVPPLSLDFGLRNDAEAQALARAATLYDRGQRGRAAAVFDRYSSVEAQVGGALATWPDGSLLRLEQLAREHPRSGVVRLNLGLAQFWEGRDREAMQSFRTVRRVDPDSFYAVRADGLLHPRFAPGLPPYTPSFDPPPAIERLSPRQRLEALRRDAAREPRVRLLYGASLQRLGKPLSARRQFALAARAAPNDVEAQTAAAVGLFDKSDPSKAFGRLGPLARRFPTAATVRFHLGLMLVWMTQVDAARKQLRLAAKLDPHGRIGGEARRFLISLENVGPK
jgi:tetratricopeptide (TPR) repeat protein